MDRAWVGCEKRRFGSRRGDLPLEMAGGGEVCVGAGAGGAGGAGGERECESIGDEMLIDEVAGLMVGLELGAR